ncbi:hypothetical protein HK107_08680 [Parvularcula sp. ZS-1/3]|uniref:VPLPA-CTERM sorting domain-containing protein n=1 Tax=Parvularcula mediterranea TaxID=2732508 RepID=A0A7Y3RLP2_9PROT|nr:VPLPA-CTERM sorting domain-containing protein [Parvularcula mediterranea]NNU16393.1 hypothetical protein [Parvularcula mediterranea]
MKKHFAIAAASLVALTGAANAASVTLDLTKRDNFATTLLGTAFGDIDVYNGIPSPNANNPIWVQVGPGNLVIKITGQPIGKGINSDETGEASCSDPENDLACDTDGLGIGNDEVTQKDNEARNQSLTVEFFNLDDGSEVFVQIDDWRVLDLFTGDESNMTAANTETAIATFSTGTVQTLAGMTNTGSTPGYERAGNQGNLDVLGVSSIVFTAGLGNDDADGDYALAAIDFTTPPGITTPIPGALPLFLAGLGGIAVARRKKRS